ncbi:MAG TPA: DUF1778 domain-containing protein [Terriglobales bacterium]|jgi:uncharacterized protein (DUF1778 family)
MSSKAKSQRTRTRRPKGGKKKEYKSIVCSVRFSKKEREIVDYAAESQHKSIGSFIAEAAMGRAYEIIRVTNRKLARQLRTG